LKLEDLEATQYVMKIGISECRADVDLRRKWLSDMSKPQGGR
jgi:hypothetical protein